jgi:hypothetical protein
MSGGKLWMDQLADNRVTESKTNNATKKKITKIDDRSVLYSFRSLLSPHMGKDNIGAFANPRMNYFKRIK